MHLKSNKTIYISASFAQQPKRSQYPSFIYNVHAKQPNDYLRLLEFYDSLTKLYYQT